MNILQHSLIFCIRFYQRVISPLKTGLLGPMSRCRFEPNCSAYALEAVRIHGGLKGCVLAVWRILRCAPWGGCGHDPVPPAVSRAKAGSTGVEGAALHGCSHAHAPNAVIGRPS